MAFLMKSGMDSTMLSTSFVSNMLISQTKTQANSTSRMLLMSNSRHESLIAFFQMARFIVIFRGQTPVL